jgi:hypothetical protein
MYTLTLSHAYISLGPYGLIKFPILSYDFNILVSLKLCPIAIIFEHVIIFCLQTAIKYT